MKKLQLRAFLHQRPRHSRREDTKAHIVLQAPPLRRKLAVSADAEGSSIQAQAPSRHLAMALEFKPVHRWPTGAWERLVEDLTASRPSQTNTHIIKFPHYRRQYKLGLRPVTRRR